MLVRLLVGEEAQLVDGDLLGRRGLRAWKLEQGGELSSIPSIL